MDFSTIKQIVIPEGIVKKIEDGDGHVIWQKAAEQPYRRLEYLIFDGTCYCQSTEHNANNRAYRLDYMQTGWASNNLCYPFGIWTNTAPQNILLTRNQRSNTSTGFETCRVGITSFGKHPSSSYLNNRMIAEMRWGTDTTVYYRLRNQSSSSYIENGVGTASGRPGTNTGNWFIGAINDGGGGTYNNANGLLVGRIYEVAIAGSNSFDDYGYAYVPCQRKSDGAVGFKQPYTDSFWPLLNKSDGSVVTNVTAHMGPIVDDNWDGVTYTITPSPIAPSPTLPEWHTLWSGHEYAELSTINDYWQSSISNTNVLATLPLEAMADGCQLRLTWSYE